jgi:hypothetical protein
LKQRYKITVGASKPFARAGEKPWDFGGDIKLFVDEKCLWAGSDRRDVSSTVSKLVTA